MKKRICANGTDLPFYREKKRFLGAKSLKK